MIDNGIRKEKSVIKKCELKIYKDGVHHFNNTNNKNHNVKPKFWNRNQNVVNDGIVDNNNVKPKQPVFNLSTHSTTAQQNSHHQKSTIKNLF